jgi:hypothetical protein
MADEAQSKCLFIYIIIHVKQTLAFLSGLITVTFVRRAGV